MTRALLALISGVALAGAFPVPDQGWLAWVALAPLIILAVTASSLRVAALEGLLFGLAFFGPVMFWWHGLLIKYGALSHLSAAATFLGLITYLSLYSTAFAAGLKQMAARRGEAWAILIAPVLWAGLELVRGRALTGFPWAVLGATQDDWPVFLQVAELGGVTLVSLVVAAGNAAAAGLVRAGRRGEEPVARMTRRRGAALLAGVVLASLGFGIARMSMAAEPGERVRLALVQGNVAQDQKWKPEARARILDSHLEATRQAAKQGARLVIWPESSVPLPLTASPGYRRILSGHASSLGIDLLVGSVHYQDRGGPGERVYNSAFLIEGGAAEPFRQRYDKIHLVPFGEYVPLRWILGPMETLVEEASDFSPGESIRNLRSGGISLAPLICFEAIFPDLARRFVLEGAGLLVNMTNDAFLGDTAGPRQHLALASVRAVENRRWMARAANTGISAVVDPRGRLHDAADYGTAATILFDVPLRGEITLYSRLGDACGWACVIVALSFLIAPGLPRGRPHGRRTSTSLHRREGEAGEAAELSLTSPPERKSSKS